jgi:homoserine kinase
LKKQQITARVPASTSNLGPGYDCLGIALRAYTYVTVSTSEQKRAEPIISGAADEFFASSRSARFSFSCTIGGDVPQSRGLGSSAAVRLGLLHALNQIAGQPLTRPQLFAICAKLEGHPDNAAPAEFGGFNVVRQETRTSFAVSPKLKFVLLIPGFEIATASARRVLPKTIDRLGAVESCGNTAMITAAFASAKYELLRDAFVDHLHQPFRQKLIPFLPDVIAAAEKAGALGAWLSGSGSTIAAVTLRDPEGVGAAMLRAGKTDARIVITTADNRGVRLIRRPPG